MFRILISAIKAFCATGQVIFDKFTSPLLPDDWVEYLDHYAGDWLGSLGLSSSGDITILWALTFGLLIILVINFVRWVIGIFRG